MTEDEHLQFLETLDQINRELRQLVDDFGRLATPEACLEHHKVMAETIGRHHRVLRFHGKLPVEPVAHSGEGILIGRFGDPE